MRNIFLDDHEQASYDPQCVIIDNVILFLYNVIVDYLFEKLIHGNTRQKN